MRRFVTRFALDLGDVFEIQDVFEGKIVKHQINKENPEIETIIKDYPAAIWMERKIKDEFGINFTNSFDNRPTVKHERFPKEIYPLRKDFTKKEIEFTDFLPYKYEEIGGEGVYTVPVGPIHGGIIESGHFQFSQAGENMLHVEVRHFYKYRAIEKMCENKSPIEVKPIIERISGNESIAYQIALFKILAQACEIEIPNSLKQKYATLLEIERLIHHITDIGAIPNDAGFGTALAYASKLAEETRRMFAKITNHRFGFGAIKESIQINYDELIEFLNYLEKEIIFFKDWIFDIPSIWDRLDTTGILTIDKAIKYSVVGLGARASGLKIDIRNNEWYKNFGFTLQTEEVGDAAARFKLRLKEILNSIEIIKNLKTSSNESIKFSDFKDGEFVSFVESSIGELFMFIKIKNGLIDRFYVRDASHVNWQAFHATVYKDIIADFPVINKSFDLSYAGNDL